MLLKRISVLFLIVFFAYFGSGCTSGSGASVGTFSLPSAGFTSTSTSSTLPGLNVDDILVLSGEKEAVFTVRLSEVLNTTVRVHYDTSDLSAVAGTDYVHSEGEVEIAPGQTQGHIFVSVLRTSFSAPVMFKVRLSNPVGAVLEDAEGLATLGAETSLLAETLFDPNWADVGVFSSATQCAQCHRTSASAPDVMTFLGQDISPPKNWGHSMMAQSFSDPYYQAVVAEEVSTFPGLAGLIEDTCLTCHAPMGRTQAHQTGSGLDPNGYYRFDTALQQMHAREGTSCTACHQIADDGKLGTASSFSGQYTISSTDRLIYGPFTSPAGMAMQNQTQYTPIEGAHIRSSAMCASCHTLYTPTIDVDSGQPTGKSFPEQTPFLEWQNSIYGPGRASERQCQQCHMPTPSDTYQTQIAVKPNGQAGTWPQRSPFNQHAMVGGNTHTLEMLRAFRTILGLSNSTSVEGFDREIETTRQLLAKETAELHLDRVAMVNSNLEVDVRVVNLTGHKLPTSFPSRRVWLHTKVSDAGGHTVFESGAPDANGQLSIDSAGLQSFEPHRNLIVAPQQVAVYESVLGDVKGQVTHVLLHADHYLKDNRIPPRGFRQSTVPADGATAITGLAASDSDFNAEDANGGSGADVVHYAVNVGGFNGPFTVEVELLYQSVRPSFVNGLQAKDDPRVERYKLMYQLIPPTVEKLGGVAGSS